MTKMTTARKKRMSLLEARDRGRAAGVHMVTHGASASFLEKTVAAFAIVGALGVMSGLASVWEWGTKVLGPVAVRPMFDLSRELRDAVGDVELKGVAEQKMEE